MGSVTEQVEPSRGRPRPTRPTKYNPFRNVIDIAPNAQQATAVGEFLDQLDSLWRSQFGSETLMGGVSCARRKCPLVQNILRTLATGVR